LTPRYRRRSDPHFAWIEGDVTFNIPIPPIEELAVTLRKLTVHHGSYKYPQEREDFVIASSETVTSPNARKMWEILSQVAGNSLEVDISKDGREIILSVADAEPE